MVLRNFGEHGKINITGIIRNDIMIKTQQNKQLMQSVPTFAVPCLLKSNVCPSTTLV